MLFCGFLPDVMVCGGFLDSLSVLYGVFLFVGLVSWLDGASAVLDPVPYDVWYCYVVGFDGRSGVRIHVNWDFGRAKVDPSGLIAIGVDGDLFAGVDWGEAVVGYPGGFGALVFVGFNFLSRVFGVNVTFVVTGGGRVAFA